MEHGARIKRLLEKLADNRLDALLVTYPTNIRYLSGFTGSAGALVIASHSVLVTDGRYTEQARAEVKGARVKIERKPALVAASEWLARGKSLRRIGFDPAHTTVAERALLGKLIGKRATLVATPAIVERLRMIKDADEIDQIRTACKVGCGLFDRLLKVTRSGVSETQVAGELEFAARLAGAEQMSFPTIIASGSRSALPHGRASQAAIPARGFVVCDFGVILAGYCSDMTRTVHVGRPQTGGRRAYNAVQEAQQAAIEAVKPGATAEDVDVASRKLLVKHGLGTFFTHSTGHGVGLDIHEAPKLAMGQKEPLLPGMVITIEPGVYLPGKYGIRIEDTVVVTGAGCEILTPCPKDLLTL